MDNLLPLLLGLVFIGVKYYNKTQKDKKKTPISKHPQENFIEKAQTSFDDFMNEFIGENKQAFKPVVSTQAYEEESIEEWKKEMHMEEPESIEYDPEISKEPSSKKLFETIQNKPLEITESIDFDLRKAVVYDAILNPPYI